MICVCAETKIISFLSDICAFAGSGVLRNVTCLAAAETKSNVLLFSGEYEDYFIYFRDFRISLWKSAPAAKFQNVLKKLSELLHNLCAHFTPQMKSSFSVSNTKICSKLFRSLLQSQYFFFRDLRDEVIVERTPQKFFSICFSDLRIFSLKIGVCCENKCAFGMRSHSETKIEISECVNLLNSSDSLEMFCDSAENTNIILFRSVICAFYLCGS